jgi:hypothetical protein
VDAETYRRALSIAGKRHDLIAIDLYDPMETRISDVGVLVLEDAETGEVAWVDTSSKAWRDSFEQRRREFDVAKKRTFAGASVDRIVITTPDDYVRALVGFFQNRARRIRSAT